MNWEEFQKGMDEFWHLLENISKLKEHEQAKIANFQRSIQKHQELTQRGESRKKVHVNSKSGLKFKPHGIECEDETNKSDGLSLKELSEVKEVLQNPQEE